MIHGLSLATGCPATGGFFLVGASGRVEEKPPDRRGGLV